MAFPPRGDPPASHADSRWHQARHACGARLTRGRGPAALDKPMPKIRKNGAFRRRSGALHLASPKVLPYGDVLGTEWRPID
jgi:hypothetical protein